MKQYQKDIRKEMKRKYPEGLPDSFGSWQKALRLLEAQYRPPVRHGTLREFIEK